MSSWKERTCWCGRRQEEDPNTITDLSFVTGGLTSYWRVWERIGGEDRFGGELGREDRCVRGCDGVRDVEEVVRRNLTPSLTSLLSCL